MGFLIAASLFFYCFLLIISVGKVPLYKTIIGSAGLFVLVITIVVLSMSPTEVLKLRICPDACSTTHYAKPVYDKYCKFCGKETELYAVYLERTEGE